MKKVLARLGEKVLELLGNVWTAYKDNPVATKLALMAALGNLWAFTPEQLSAFEGFIDGWTPVILLVLGIRLRNQVTPVENPKVVVKVPVKPVVVPEGVPVGPSGAF